MSFTYADKFRCISSDCEDTCCIGFQVPVDQATVERFKTLPPSPLRILIQASVQLEPKDTEGARRNVFATLRMDSSHQCPLFSQDRLCRIHSEYGEEFLPNSCAVYPRINHSVGGVQENALALSCPEAARIVLLDPCLAKSTSSVATFSQGEDSRETKSLHDYFWSIRELVVAIVCNRDYPLWQRLFLLGTLCQQLDSTLKGELQYPIGASLRAFAATVASGAPRESLSRLRVDFTQQLEVVLRLAGMLLDKSRIYPRFSECIHAFTTGIGNGPGATLGSLTDNYAKAYDQFYAPFFDRHPYILENYLLNTIVRCQFPFGPEPDKPPSLHKAYGALLAQFTLMKGLLIGVAGSHREGFSKDHVVHTIQSASRHFEHYTHFLDEAYALLAESRMVDEWGWGILLRNAHSGR